MSNLFGACPNDIGGTLNATAAPLDEVAVEGEKYPAFSRKQWKIIKKVRKLLKKQNKILKREIKRQDTESENEKKSDNRRGMGFFQEFGKAFCKALPTILTTLVPMAFKFIFMGKQRNGSSSLKLA